MSRATRTVISLGGSLIVPDHIDVRYLRRLKNILRPSTERRYLIICGGGATSRRYIEAARQTGARPSSHDLDLMGIRAIELNAEFVRLIFGAHAHRDVLSRPADVHSLRSPVIVCSAAESGHSSDYNAVVWAARNGVTQVVNLTNIRSVFDRDPKKSRAAKPLKNLDWETYRSIIGTRWTPGLNTPFDPVASFRAERLKLTVKIVHGHDLASVKNALAGRTFVGTVLHP